MEYVSKIQINVLIVHCEGLAIRNSKTDRPALPITSLLVVGHELFSFTLSPGKQKNQFTILDYMLDWIRIKENLGK